MMARQRENLPAAHLKYLRCRWLEQANYTRSVPLAHSAPWGTNPFGTRGEWGFGAAHWIRLNLLKNNKNPTCIQRSNHFDSFNLQ